VSHEVFIDTSAWIAVSDVSDRYHTQAREAYRRMIDEHRTFVTTNLVIAEAYLVIRRMGGPAQAIRWIRSLRGSPRLQKVWSDSSLEAQAEELLERYTDQDFSYADAVSFGVMNKRGIRDAFTFDHHFATVGFQMIPSR
jgi:hypothetical protein